MKSFTVKEIEQMAEDLTVKTPQIGDKVHNSALERLVERAKLLAQKEDLEDELAANNVVSINKNKKKAPTEKR